MAGMKIPGLLLAALVVLAVPVPAQNHPDAPAPSPQLSDQQWQEVEQLPHGQPISIEVLNGFPLQCRFAGATDAFLFCDRMDGPAGEAGYRIDRVNVLRVTQVRPPHNWHPGLVIATAIAGTLVGVAETRSADAGTSARVGSLAGLIVFGIGYLAVTTPNAFAGVESMDRPRPVKMHRHARLRPHPRLRAPHASLP